MMAQSMTLQNVQFYSGNKTVDNYLYRPYIKCYGPSLVLILIALKGYVNVILKSRPTQKYSKVKVAETQYDYMVGEGECIRRPTIKQTWRVCWTAHPNNNVLI